MRGSRSRRGTCRSRALSDVDCSGHKHHDEAAKHPYAVLIQRIRSFDGWAESSAGPVVGGSRGSRYLVGSLLVLALQHAVAGDFKRQLLSRLRIAGDFRDGVRLVGRLLVQVHAGLGWSKCNRARQDGHEMLQRIDQSRINGRLPVVRQVITDLKLRLTRAQRKNERITPLLSLRRGLNVYALPTLSLRLRIVNRGTFRHVELKVGIVHLGEGRLGSVVHRKNSGDPELTLR